MVSFFIEGHYMYIESSAPRRRGDAARLWTPKFNPKAGQCISFWYHMFGRTMGTLNVYAADMSATTPVIGSPIWSLSGNQGNIWMQEYVRLPTPTVASVRIHLKTLNSIMHGY